MSVFISGGCKNGKSYHAQRLAKDMAGAFGGPLYYIATMEAVDAEDEERIARHRQERAGWGFETIECGRDILNCLRHARPNGVFLLDSVTALLANEMFPPQGGINEDAGEKVARELVRFLALAPRTVLVSDFIYADAQRYDALTERYRENLARIDCALAQSADVVLEIAHGQVITHKRATAPEAGA